MLQLTLGFDQALIDPNVASGVFLFGVKAFFLLGVFTYLIFAFVMVRQIVVMKKTLITPVSPILQIVSWAHLLTVVFFGLLFLVIL